RPRTLLRDLLIQRRTYSPTGADRSGQPDHGAASSVGLQRGNIHERHADDVQYGMRSLGRKHHEREHLAQALHERHVGQPADSGRPAIGSGITRRVLQQSDLSLSMWIRTILAIAAICAADIAIARAEVPTPKVVT